MGVMHHEAVMKNIIPVVMAGVLGIYGLIVAVILIQAGILKSHTIFLSIACHGFQLGLRKLVQPEPLSPVVFSTCLFFKRRTIRDIYLFFFLSSSHGIHSLFVQFPVTPTPTTTDTHILPLDLHVDFLD